MLRRYLLHDHEGLEPIYSIISYVINRYMINGGDKLLYSRTVSDKIVKENEDEHDIMGVPAVLSVFELSYVIGMYVVWMYDEYGITLVVNKGLDISIDSSDPKTVEYYTGLEGTYASWYE